MKVRNFDVVKAIEENYMGTLNNLKIDVNDLFHYYSGLVGGSVSIEVNFN